MIILAAIEVLWFVSVFYLVLGVLAMRPRPGLNEQLASLSGQERSARVGPLPIAAGLDQSFHVRVVVPLLMRLGRLLEMITPARTLAAARLRVERAGSPHGLTAMQFLGLRAASTALGVLAGLALLRWPMATGMANGLIAVLAVFAGILLPDYWLERQIEARERAIKVALPYSIDLMVACAEAGLGLDQSLSEVMRRQPGPLADEFGRLLKEVGLGKTRAEAWRDLSHRVGVEELRLFASAIYQADQMGTSIARVLRGQSDALRARYSMWVREEAAKLPVKMMFPLVFFIFPALFVVVLGPASVSIMRSMAFLTP